MPVRNNQYSKKYQYSTSIIRTSSVENNQFSKNKFSNKYQYSKNEFSKYISVSQ